MCRVDALACSRMGGLRASGKCNNVPDDFGSNFRTSQQVNTNWHHLACCWFLHVRWRFSLMFTGKGVWVGCVKRRMEADEQELKKNMTELKAVHVDLCMRGRECMSSKIKQA